MSLTFGAARALRCLILIFCCPLKHKAAVLQLNAGRRLAVSVPVAGMKEARPHWNKAQAIPAVVALVTFIIIVVALYLLKLKRWGFGRLEGTAYVTDYDGQTVRRSTRWAPAGGCKGFNIQL